MEELRRKSERTMGILEEENKKLQTDVEKVCSDWFISKVKKKNCLYFSHPSFKYFDILVEIHLHK